MSAVTLQPRWRMVGGAAQERMMMSDLQHRRLKATFLVSPFGDQEQAQLSLLVDETGLDTEAVSQWFTVMRQRTNINKFLNRKDANQRLSDPVPEQSKTSGMSPLDCVVTTQGRRDSDKTTASPSIGDATYNDDTGIFEEDESTDSETPDLEGQGEPVSKEPEADGEAAAAEEVRVKKEPVTEGGDELGPAPAAAVKGEKLSVEEKASKYDQLRLEMDGLQKQMEEMRRRLAEHHTPAPGGPGVAPGVAPGVKQEAVVWPGGAPGQYQYPGPPQYHPYPYQPYVVTYQQPPAQYQLYPPQYQQLQPLYQQQIYSATPQPLLSQQIKTEPGGSNATIK